jgi:hypothetical protein
MGLRAIGDKAYLSVLNKDRGQQKPPKIKARLIGRNNPKMLKHWLDSRSLQRARQDSDALLLRLRSISKREVTSKIAETALARRFLRQSTTLTQPFPEALFRGFVTLDWAASARLVRYVRELRTLGMAIAADADESRAILASGVEVLTVSLRALTPPELRASGRDLWSELLRGRDDWAHTLQRWTQLGDADIQALCPFPDALTAEAN